jgi:hypothetical protein
MNRPSPLFFALLLLTGATVAAPTVASDQPLRPEKALAWKPPEFPIADLHPRIPFLDPAREWERMDVWVPKTPDTGRLPCVVVIYGGGYGEKNMPVKDWRPLLDRGYVVAAPDYALQSRTPVPLCAWDIACAIRHLRTNAEKYRIDPERIGVWGWSAGGWIVQDLFYAGPRRLVSAKWRVDGNRKEEGLFPMLQPGMRLPGPSIRVQAVVSDWGAGKLWDRRTQAPVPWLTPDDPPLLTCYPGERNAATVNPVVLLQRLGIPARGMYGFTKNTHVPDLKTPCTDEEGKPTTWGESIYDYFDATLKAMNTATAPEMIPHGGFIAAGTSVHLLTVHPEGTIHYTLDGSDPDKTSARYDAPLRVQAGDCLKAVVLRPGWKPSRITTGRFRAGPPQPRITTASREFKARIGRPFSVTFEARNAGQARWLAGGKPGETFRQYGGQRFNPPRHIPWMRLDTKSGVLAGTPRHAGVYPVIVSCISRSPGSKEMDPPWSADAILVVVRVEP